ncbi:MAG: fibronectin type III domain-containing protein [Lachnospiraceae bacterium]|nr:fibronectin type III domain-containing protein [Lachnospiraceae bacterium]
MKQIMKRILAGLLIVIFLTGSMSNSMVEVLAATISSLETEDAVTLKNEYVEVSVNKKNAGYVIKTIEGDILTKTDNNKQLNYRGGEGDTSFVTLRINGKNYIYGNTRNGGKFITKPYVDADKIISTWTQDDITVTQTLTMLTDSQDEKLGAVKIEYTVWNTNDASAGEEGAVNVGARLVLDTQLGAQDYAVYEMAPNDVNGTYIQYTRETAFAQNDIAAHFRSLDNNYQPRLVAYGYPDDSGIKPDKLVFGHWYNMAENLWDYEILGDSFVDTDAARYKTADSAIAMYWNESSLGADEKRTYSYYYGIQSNEDVGENDTVKLSVSMDKDYLTLNEEKTGYVDDEIHLQVMVSNTMPNSKTRAKMAVKLAIDTDYLTVLSAEAGASDQVDVGKDIIFLTNLKLGQTRIINWTLKVKNPPETIRYLKYIVKAYTFTEVTEEEAGNTLLDSNVVDTVKRNILAPGISGEKPSISILAGMPDELYYNGKRTFVVRGEGFEILASDKTEWQLKMTDLQTSAESFIDSSNIQFNADGTSMLVTFTEQMAEGEYQLTILPGTNLTDEQVGLPESITSDEMRFFMSSDEDLINPPVGGVGIRKEETNGIPRYEIDVFETAAEAVNAADYLLVLTGNLYQTVTAENSNSQFIPIHGSGEDSSILINRIVKFSGKEMIIDYMYEGGERVGVQVKMEGNAGVIGGSNNIWGEESQIILENGKDYSLDPGDVESGFYEPVSMEMTGISGFIQKAGGFIVDLKYGVFNKRGSYNTISFGGSLSVGFMSIDQYDGVDGVDLFAADVQDVRYGETGGKTGFIGVKAETFVGVPQFMSTLPADLEGSLKIDTIDYPYLVNVAGKGSFATFKADFELEIIASKEHGVPVPNVISFSVGGVKPGAPIILPVAPVVYLHGAAGRVDGLYSLFYPSETGGWPDSSITLAGQLSILDIFKGWVGVSLGTASASVQGEDMTILGVSVLDHVQGKFIWYPEISFSLSAKLEVMKVIQGEVKCYLLLQGEDAPDMEIYGRAAVVLPSAFFGEDLTLAGVEVGGNKSKIYGSATCLQFTMAYEYYWGSKSPDIDVSFFSRRMGSGDNAGTFAINNIQRVAKSTGESIQQANTYSLRARSISSPAVSISETGELLVSGMTGTDTMIRAYYDVQGEETIDIDDVNVNINGESYALTGVETDDNGYASNMNVANYMSGSDELGTYMLISVLADKMTGDVSISSDKATFSYGEVMVVTPVISLNTVTAEADSDSLAVTTTMSDTENAEGYKEVYLSKTAEGSRDYPIMTVDAEGNGYGLDADTSTLDIPYFVPNGEYYVTVVIRGTQDGRNFTSELTTTDTITVVNDEAPTAALTKVTAAASGDGNALVSLEGYDAAFMDGVYFSADRINSDSTVTEGYQAAFIDNTAITDGQFEVALSPEETGNDYVFHVYPTKNIAVEEEEPKYAMGYETVSETINIPYPDAAKVTVSYGTTYVEEEASLGNGDEAVTYTNKVFTNMPADGIKIDASTDKPVTGKILLNDQIISEITVAGTTFPSYYAKLEDGEHALRIETVTEDGDTRIVDEAIKVDTVGPPLQMFTPETGSVVENNQITISGQTEPDVTLAVTVNGKEIALTDAEVSGSTFETTITLPEEISQDMVYELTLKATDRYGRDTYAKASLMNPSIETIESVYLAFDGEKIESDTLSVTGKTSGKLTMYGVTESGEDIAISDESVIFLAAEDGENDGITVDVNGNVSITGEAAVGVAAQYYVTEDYCYQADVLLDSYEEVLKTEDAKEPVITTNLKEEVICVSAGEEFSMAVEAESADGGTISYTWLHKDVDGEFRAVEGNSAEFKTTLEDTGTIHQYCVSITNTTRTTGNTEATVISPIVTVYVKNVIDAEDLQIAGESVTKDETDWYTGDVIVSAKEEGAEIALLKKETEPEWKDELVLSGEETGVVSYSVMLRKNGQYVSEVYTLVVNKDHTAPTGSITLGENIWTKLLEIITFGIYKDESQTVEIAASDAHVGMAENGISCYKSASATAMTVAELDALEESAWIASNRAVLENESSVIYARFTDALGNVSYISSDGIVVGDAAPSVEIQLEGTGMLEGETKSYQDKAEIKLVITDDVKSAGIKKITYQINDGEEKTIAVEEGQTETEAAIMIDSIGINTLTIVTEDNNGNTATICETITIYSSLDAKLAAAEEIIYDKQPLEPGVDVILSAGESKGEVTWSYRSDASKEYTEGLPTNAGVYEVKASIAKDTTNYYVAAEKIIEVEIKKASQILNFSSDCYQPATGSRFYVIVGGVSSTGEIQFTAGDTEMLTIVESDLAYDAETQIVRVPAEVHTAGNTTITISVAADENHEAAEKSVNVQVLETVSPEHPYTITGIAGDNGWYKSDISIQAADGYTLALEEAGEYQSSYSVVGEGKNLAPETMYFKTDVGDTYAITMDTVNIDMTAPEGTLTAGESVWRQFLNTITFGTFFKDTVVVEVKDAKDSVSGVNTIQYYQSDKAMTMEEVLELTDNAWTDSKITLEPDQMAVVYAKLTDMAGNTAYLSTDGMIADKTPAIIELKPSYDVNQWITVQDAKVDVTVEDALAGIPEDGITYQIDGGTVFAGEKIFTIEGLEDGIHNILVTVKDNSGNTAAETITWKQDTKAPVVELSAMNNKTIGIHISTGVSGVASVEVSGDGTAWKDITETYNEGYVVNAAGTYEVRLTTNAGVTVNDTITMEEIRDTQTITVNKSEYTVILGQKAFNLGAVSDKGTKLAYRSSNEEIVKVDEKGEVTILGSGEAEIAVYAEDSESYQKAEIVVAIHVLEPYTITGVKGNKNWYRTDVTIQAANGYTLSTEADGEYLSSYMVTKEGENTAPKTMYFKSLDGEITEIAIEAVNIDKTAPEGALEAGESVWREFLNTITFGNFFKDTIVAEVKEVKDTVSGVDSIRYYQSDKALTLDEVIALNDDNWTNTKITLEPNQTAVVYAKLMDMAGNVTYLSTDGIVTDAVLPMLSVKPSYDTTKWITDTDAIINVTVEDAMSGIADSGITCQIDNGMVITKEEAFTIANLEDGAHTILITAADKAGNVAAETIVWKQDTKTPTLKLLASDNRTIKVAVSTGASGIASIQISGDGTNWTDITENYAAGYVVNAAGTYEARLTTNAGVTVSDSIVMEADGSAGNNGNTKEQQSITVSKTAYTLALGQKPFNLGAKSDKGTILTYTSSNQKVVKIDANGKVTVKGCGKAEIVIRTEETEKYQSAEKVISITVTPKQVKLKSVKSKKAKTMVIKWKRDKKVNGYQITFAKNKKFKKAKSFTVNKNKVTKFTIKKLSAKKTYYVKVRAFKKVAGEKIYGKYSKVKKVKVK